MERSCLRFRSSTVNSPAVENTVLITATTKADIYWSFSIVDPYDIATLIPVNCCVIPSATARM